MGWIDSLLSKASGAASRAVDAVSRKAQGAAPHTVDRLDSFHAARRGLAAWIAVIVLGGAVGIAGSKWVSAALESHVNSFGVDVPFSQRPTDTPTTLPQSRPVTIPAANKPLSVAACVPPPVLAYPPDGALRSANTLVRWTSALPLKDGEQYVVLATQDLSDLKGTDGELQDAVGTTTHDNLALDFSSWKYAGRLGRFFWLVRIEGTGEQFVDCGGMTPLSFVVTTAARPTRRSKERMGGEGNNPPPPPNPNPKP